jgi:hypothetical protein
MRDTKYSRELASADVRNCRIERIFVKAENQAEIRFAWWPDGKMANRPLDIPETHLLEMMSEAIRQRVFSNGFLQGLTRLLAERATYSHDASSE